MLVATSYTKGQPSIGEESDFRRTFRTTRPDDTQGWNDTKVLVQMVDLEVETVFSSSSMTALGRPR
jgi:hypothetical protein